MLKQSLSDLGHWMIRMNEKSEAGGTYLSFHPLFKDTFLLAAFPQMEALSCLQLYLPPLTLALMARVPLEGVCVCVCVCVFTSITLCAK